jgi:hypothetical protein
MVPPRLPLARGAWPCHSGPTQVGSPGRWFCRRSRGRCRSSGAEMMPAWVPSCSHPGAADNRDRRRSPRRSGLTGRCRGAIEQSGDDNLAQQPASVGGQLEAAVDGRRRLGVASHSWGPQGHMRAAITAFADLRVALTSCRPVHQRRAGRCRRRRGVHPSRRANRRHHMGRGGPGAQPAVLPPRRGRHRAVDRRPSLAGGGRPPLVGRLRPRWTDHRSRVGWPIAGPGNRRPF